MGEFECVPDEVGEHLAETKGIANQPVGNRGHRVRDEFDVLLDHRGPERLGDLLQHLTETERRLFELQLVRFDLREVQNVVENPQEVARRGVSHADVLMRLGRKIRFESQPAHVDDRVHRSTNLVTHHREKRSLGPIRPDRLLPGRDQVSIRRLLRRDRIVYRTAEVT